MWGLITKTPCYRIVLIRLLRKKEEELVIFPSAVDWHRLPLCLLTMKSAHYQVGAELLYLRQTESQKIATVSWHSVLSLAAAHRGTNRTDALKETSHTLMRDTV